MNENIPIDPPPPIIKPKTNLLPLYIAGGIIVFILITAVLLVMGLSLIKKAVPVPIAPKPTPPAPPVESVTPTNPKYASDSALLKLRDDAKNLGTQIDSVDLFEPQLSSPNIDLNLNIK